MDWLVERTVGEARRLCEIRERMSGTFDRDILAPMKDSRGGPDAIVRKKQGLAERRRVNLGEDVRMVRVVYWDEAA